MLPLNKDTILAGIMFVFLVVTWIYVIRLFMKNYKTNNKNVLEEGETIILLEPKPVGSNKSKKKPKSKASKKSTSKTKSIKSCLNSDIYNCLDCPKVYDCDRGTDIYF